MRFVAESSNIEDDRRNPVMRARTYQRHGLDPLDQIGFQTLNIQVESGVECHNGELARFSLVSEGNGSVLCRKGSPVR